MGGGTRIMREDAGREKGTKNGVRKNGGTWSAAKGRAGEEKKNCD